MKRFTRSGAVGMAAFALLAAHGIAGESTVYRCGSDGRTFSDRPCGDGSASETRFDVPDAARVGEARQVARSEAALADRLAVERRQREEHPGGGSGGFDVRPRAHLDKGPVTVPKKRRTAKGARPADDVERRAADAPFEARAATLRK